MSMTYEEFTTEFEAMNNELRNVSEDVLDRHILSHIIGLSEEDAEMAQLLLSVSGLEEATELLDQMSPRDMVGVIAVQSFAMGAMFGQRMQSANADEVKAS